MHHLAKITFGKFEMIPFHAECACGTAGDFSSNQEAKNWIVGHLARLQGINSAELVDETSQPLPPPPAEEPAPEQETEEQPAPKEEPEPQTQAEAAG